MHHRVSHRVKKTENITIYRIPTRNFYNTKETYNTQGNVGNRTRSPTLCRKIEPGVLTTLPRRPIFILSGLFHYLMNGISPNLIREILINR